MSERDEFKDFTDAQLREVVQQVMGRALRHRIYVELATREYEARRSTSLEPTETDDDQA